MPRQLESAFVQPCRDSATTGASVRSQLSALCTLPGRRKSVSWTRERPADGYRERWYLAGSLEYHRRFNERHLDSERKRYGATHAYRAYRNDAGEPPWPDGKHAANLRGKHDELHDSTANRQCLEPSFTSSLASVALTPGNSTTLSLTALPGVNSSNFTLVSANAYVTTQALGKACSRIREPCLRVGLVAQGCLRIVRAQHDRHHGRDLRAYSGLCPTREGRPPRYLPRRRGPGVAGARIRAVVCR